MGTKSNENSEGFESNAGLQQKKYCANNINPHCINVRWAVEEVILPFEKQGTNGPINLILSVQLLSSYGNSIPGQTMGISILNQSMQLFKNEKMEIISVANTIDKAKEKSSLYSVAGNSKGKIYCSINIDLPSEKEMRQIEYPSQEKLIGMGVFITGPGEEKPIDLKPMADGGALDKLSNILVEVGKDLIVTPTELYRGIPGKTYFSLAAIPDRMTILKWIYERYLDGLSIILFPEYIASKMNGMTKSEFRAILGGYTFGFPYGIYNNIAGTMEDIKFLVWDIPTAFLKFEADRIKKNPVILITLDLKNEVANYVVEKGLEAYDFINKHGENIKKLLSICADAAMKIGIEDWWKIVCSMYEKHLKPVLSMLGYVKGTLEHDFFIMAFVAGDISGYLSFEIGIQAVMEFFTKGIGNVVKILSKLGKVGKVLLDVFKIVMEFAEAVKNIFGIIERFVKKIGEFVKKGTEKAAKLFNGIFKFFSESTDEILATFFGFIKKAVKESGEKFDGIVEIFLKFASHFIDADIDIASVLKQFWEGLNEIISKSTNKIIDIVLGTFEFFNKTAMNVKGFIPSISKNLKKVTKACGLIIDAGLNEIISMLPDGIENETDSNETVDFMSTIADDWELIKQNIVQIKKETMLFSIGDADGLFRDYLNGMKVYFNVEHQ